MKFITQQLRLQLISDKQSVYCFTAYAQRQGGVSRSFISCVARGRRGDGGGKAQFPLRELVVDLSRTRSPTMYGLKSRCATCRRDVAHLPAYGSSDVIIYVKIK